MDNHGGAASSCKGDTMDGFQSPLLLLDCFIALVDNPIFIEQLSQHMIQLAVATCHLDSVVIEPISLSMTFGFVWGCCLFFFFFFVNVRFLVNLIAIHCSTICYQIFMFHSLNSVESCDTVFHTVKLVDGQ